MFHVGQKVEFVGCPEGWRDYFYRMLHPYSCPAKKTPYTVSNVYYEGSAVCVELLEFPSLETRYWAAGFLAESFRPLTDSKTEVSFTAGAPRDSRKWDNRHKVRERT